MTSGRPQTRERRYCAVCAKELSRSTRGAYCRAHYASDTELNARRAAAIRQTWALKPHLLAERSRKVAEANRRPERREISAQVCQSTRLWERGLPAMQTTEARQRQAASQSRSKLAHIPIERLDDYRALTLKVGAREAERIVLEHNSILAIRGCR